MFKDTKETRSLINKSIRKQIFSGISDFLNRILSQNGTK